jgi:hypothetical protein
MSALSDEVYKARKEAPGWVSGLSGTTAAETGAAIAIVPVRRRRHRGSAAALYLDAGCWGSAIVVH